MYGLLAFRLACGSFTSFVHDGGRGWRLNGQLQRWVSAVAFSAADSQSRVPAAAVDVCGTGGYSGSGGKQKRDELLFFLCRSMLCWDWASVLGVDWE